MRHLFTFLSLIQCITASTPQYSDKKISIMIKDYFESNSNAPELLGYRFYKDKKEQVIQIEINSENSEIDNVILFGFKTMSIITNFSKTKFTKSNLIIYIPSQTLPIIATSTIACSNDFFILKSINEFSWKKNCLTIQNI